MNTAEQGATSGMDNPLDSQTQQRVRSLYWIAMVAALAMIALRANFTTDSAFALLSRGDNDDILRYLSVQAWFGGQNWFDMTQYRILAPEGVDLHWSRYVDAGIGTLQTLAGLWAAPATAEAFAIVVWPLLLIVLLVGYTGELARRTFGHGTAILAVAFLVMWPVFLDNYFAATRVDHHNVQILLLTILIGSLASHQPSKTRGAVAGIASALSLAVGLEIAVAIALAGVILGVRTFRNPETDGGQLVVFLTTMAGLSLLLFLGQTPEHDWPTPHCDELSAPFLALLAAGAVIGWGFRFGLGHAPTMVARTVILVVAALAGASIAYWLLGACIKGPYASLPQAVQDIIASEIIEAGPITQSLANGSPAAIMILVPTIIGIAMGLVILIARHGRDSRTLGVFLAFATLGLVGMFSQQRFVVVAAGAVPMLVGVGLSALVSTFLTNTHRWAAGLVGAAALGCTILLPPLYSTVTSITPLRQASMTASGDVWATGCRDRDHLRELSRLPAGTVLTPDRIGSSLLLVSDHTIIAAPYHRSPKAMASIEQPFSAPEPAFRAFVTAERVDYVVMCKLIEQGTAESFARDLASGVTAPGFRRIELDEESPLVAYRVAE